MIGDMKFIEEPISSDVMLAEGWQDAEKELPEIEKPVLVYCQYASDNGYELDIGWRGHIHWISTTTGEKIEVKYWHILPEPPAQTKEDTC